MRIPEITDPLLVESNRAAHKGMKAVRKIKRAEAEEARRERGTKGHQDAIHRRHDAQRQLDKAYGAYEEIEKRQLREATL